MSKQTKRASVYLAQWKERTRPRELELSDGFRVRIRPARVENLVISGTIPQTLLREMQAVDPQDDGTYSDEDVQKMLPVIDAVVLAVVIDPPVTREWDEDSDAIALDDIPFVDKVTIFQEVNRPATELQSFRQQPDGDEADPPAG